MAHNCRATIALLCTYCSVPFIFIPSPFSSVHDWVQQTSKSKSWNHKGKQNVFGSIVTSISYDWTQQTLIPMFFMLMSLIMMFLKLSRDHLVQKMMIFALAIFAEPYGWAIWKNIAQLSANQIAV